MAQLTNSESLNVVLLCATCDGEDVGESWTTFNWARKLSRLCNVTILTYHKDGHTPTSEQIQTAEIVEWHDLPLVHYFPKFNNAAKPKWSVFYWQVRGWLKREIRRGRRIDLVHQISPLALRHSCPAVGLGLPYIIGPVAGSLPTPDGFSAEVSMGPLFMRLRQLDRIRFKCDPILRRGYENANMVIGVAPYVQDLLPMKIKRFEAISEIGMEEVSAAKAYTEELCLGAKLLYVGRIVRTKGLRDAITALSMIPKTLKWRLDVLGDGDDREYCENLVSQLRLRDAIHFHGRVPRSIVDGYYRNADLFLFPSFREPSGNVVIEALSHGLPVITSSIGGPGFAVDGSCGRTIRAVSPQQYSKDIAKALLELLRDPIEMSRLSCGAIERVKSEYLWSNKAQRMLQIYRDVVDKHHS